MRSYVRRLVYRRSVAVFEFPLAADRTTFSVFAISMKFDGMEYSEACDPAEFGRTYIEGDVMPVDEGEAQEILNIILGVDE